MTVVIVLVVWVLKGLVLIEVIIVIMYVLINADYGGTRRLCVVDLGGSGRSGEGVKLFSEWR